MGEVYEADDTTPVRPFSIGILLYEMATGLRPFRGDAGTSILSAIIKDEPTSITRLRPGASRDLERLVKQCLMKDPAKQTDGSWRSRGRRLDFTSAATESDIWTLRFDR